jgi:DnaJ family protein C protein 7
MEEVEMELEIDEPEEKTSAEKAEEKKIEGNAFYAKKDYESAVRLYTEAIELCPTCAAYYGNRAATYMMLYKYEKALEDARTSTQINPNFVKGYQREAKCHLAMGEIATAVLSYEKVLQLDPNNSVAKSEQSQAREVQRFIS